MIQLTKEFFVDVTLRTFGQGGYTDGLWSGATPTDTTVKASIQPANGDDLLQVPEGERSSEVLVAYTLEPVYVSASDDDLRPSDEIVYDGRVYKVQHVGDWHNPGANLKHYRSVMTRKRK